MDAQNRQTAPIEDLIAKGYLLLTPHGISMWPMIRFGKDSVQIEPVSGRLCRFDVPVYRRASGQVVFHRILKVVDGGYLICGDNQSVLEFVRDDQILGVMRAYYRREKRIELTAKRYRFYLRTYCSAPLWMRKVFLFFVHLPRRVCVKIKRAFCKKKH